MPLEVQLNGVAHMTHIRSTSLAGLSIITIIYDDNTTTFNARQEVLDRLQLVTLQAGVNPGLDPDYSPTGQIVFYTLTSTNPKYDVVDLKALQDWFVLNQLKSVPNVVDVNIFGGPKREYQVQLDPNKLVSYGISLSTVEQALANNNINAGVPAPLSHCHRWRPDTGAAIGVFLLPTLYCFWAGPGDNLPPRESRFLEEASTWIRCFATHWSITS